MQYQWDPRKAAINLRKHGIEFADSVAAFEDDFAWYKQTITLTRKGLLSWGRMLLAGFLWWSLPIETRRRFASFRREEQQGESAEIMR